MKSVYNRGFTLVEVIIAVTLSLVILAAVMSTFIMCARSSIRIANYDRMEAQAARALEILARDLRMAETIVTEDTPKIPAASRNIQKITLTIPDAIGAGTTLVVYQFTGSTFTRTIAGNSEVLVNDITSNTGKFEAYNLVQAYAANDLETNQIKISMTASPDTKGLYANTTKRIISARFVLRNR